MYVTQKGANCETVTPRGWEFCVSHTGKLGEQLDESRDSVTVTLELPALGKQIGDLNSADFEAIRLRLTRTQPLVQCEDSNCCNPCGTDLGSVAAFDADRV